jgi:hypothetical protein
LANGKQEYDMKKLLLMVLLIAFAGISLAQTPADTLESKIIERKADDPSDFLTRAEVFTEFQHYNNFNLELTTFRAIAKLGKRFTTRVDIPVNYNSLSTEAGYKQYGLGDITFRLLGYKIIETPKSAVTASVEFSLNTAQSPLLGTGKNLIIPVVSYTAVLKPKRILLSLVLQQANSFSGDEKRGNISFSKLQAILITIWSRKVWTVVAPEFYLDYVHGGLSMDFAGRFAYAPVPRINLWAQAGAGLFGDFVGRYIWSTQIGGRYFFMKNSIFKGMKNQG